MSGERTTTGDIRRGFDVLLKLMPAFTMIAGLTGAAYVSLHRLGEVEKRIEKVEAALETKASAADLSGIKRALGNVQLDVAVICSEIVKQRGGDPIRECRTSRGGD
jgi:hypothetical protein